MTSSSQTPSGPETGGFSGAVPNNATESSSSASGAVMTTTGSPSTQAPTGGSSITSATAATTSAVKTSDTIALSSQKMGVVSTMGIVIAVFLAFS